MSNGTSSDMFEALGWKQIDTDSLEWKRADAHMPEYGKEYLVKYDDGEYDTFLATPAWGGWIRMVNGKQNCVTSLGSSFAEIPSVEDEE